MMKILVTGSTGFLGSSLCPHLEVLGHEVVKTSTKLCDLTLSSELNQYNQWKFDRIFHLAAWTQAGDFSLYHPGEQWIINQQINTNVLFWWQRYQSQAKLVSMGTSCSYEEGIELEEANYLLGSPIESLYAYGMCKRMMHIGQTVIAKQFGLKYLTIVPSTLYGPGYHTDNKQLHFIFDIIKKILRYKHTGAPIILWGDGSQRRELVYINDFVSALIYIDDNVENDIYNIGAGSDFSIKEIAEMACKIAGVNSEVIEYDFSKHVGAKCKMLSNKKLNQLMPNRKTISLEIGLRVVINDFEHRLFGK